VALHLALVAAYAGTLRTGERDAERALLHSWHQEGDHATLGHTDGFLLETIYARPWHINVMEYYGMPGDQRVLWRFTVRDSAELIESTYLLMEKTTGSNSAPARIGLLRYSGEPDLVPEHEGQLVKTYTGEPSYDLVRSDVLQQVRALPVLPGR
jgi:hypothetical protein